MALQRNTVCISRFLTFGLNQELWSQSRIQFVIISLVNHRASPSLHLTSGLVALILSLIGASLVDVFLHRAGNTLRNVLLRSLVLSRQKRCETNAFACVAFL